MNGIKIENFEELSNSIDKIKFDNMNFRKDIGLDLL